MHEKPDQDGEASLCRATNQTITALSDLARIFHESLTATTKLGTRLRDWEERSERE